MGIKWHAAKLYDLAGKEMGHVRVPADPFPPGIIIWGNRYFMLALPDGNYAEAKCHLVPIERMYPAPQANAGLPFRKSER